MQQVIIPLTEHNTEINEDLKEYNLVLNINLIPLWELIEEEARHYEGDVYLYIQTRYTIPIKGFNVETTDEGRRQKTSCGVTDFIRLSEVSESRQVTVNTVYAGTYDETRAEEIISESKIWLYELK